ncbi:MAG: rhodanese-like domain-containing protein [Prevotella sp.]|nr:rhodanese-like domain-containing protein [Prevotella sp.]
MKKFFSFIMVLLGIHAGTACGQQHFDNVDVKGFAELIQNPDVQLLDVRTAEEYAEAHLDKAINIDVKKQGFIDQAVERLDTNKVVAVYCRSGRRSANAAEMLAEKGFKAFNLEGGIIAWKNEQMPVVSSIP